jgi:L-ribulokinase
MAWLWKDHTGVAEAVEITGLAGKIRPRYLAKCGGTYSSEWFWSKILHCLRTSPKAFNAAHCWVELADYVPAALTGTEHPDQFIAGVCAAGHKAMWNTKWGGYPDAQFLSKLDPKLGKLRSHLTSRVHSIDRAVGGLTAAWAKKTGLRAGIPVAVGAFDAHLGAVGCGVTPRTGKNSRTCPACAASWTAVCCPVTSASKPGNRQWATFSTGSSITSSPAAGPARMKS